MGVLGSRNSNVWHRVFLPETFLLPNCLVFDICGVEDVGSWRVADNIVPASLDLFKSRDPFLVLSTHHETVYVCLDLFTE